MVTSSVLILTVGAVIIVALVAGAIIESVKAKTGKPDTQAGINQILAKISELKQDCAWEPIDTCPRDQKVYLWHKDKTMYHIVMEDLDPSIDLAANGYTHWRLRFPDPNDM